MDGKTSNLAIRAPDDDEAAIYRKADCKGQKLLGACMTARSQAGVYIQPVDSLWTVPITQWLTAWGYKMETDNGNAQWRASHEDECELAINHNLRRMCTALGIDTRSTYQGGPNRCYFATHANSAAVIRDAQGRLPPVNQQWYKVAGNNYRVSEMRARTLGWILTLMSSRLPTLNPQSESTSPRASSS